jgi:hypothetical protein
MIRHCNDRQLGSFDYDDELFRIDLVEDDTYDSWDNLRCLRYIGENEDCSKLKLPHGLLNCRYMFENSPITKPPVIPEGVLNCEAMFRGSMITYGPNIPKTVTNCDHMFEASMIQKAPAILPTIKTGVGMFSYCKDLKRKAAYLGSGNFKEFDDMYSHSRHIVLKKDELEKELEEDLPFL